MSWTYRITRNKPTVCLIMNKLNVLLLLTFSLWCFFLQAQVSSPLTAGARGLSMGGAGLSFTGIHAAWSNPAGLSELDGLSAALYGEQRFALTDLRQISAVGAIPTSSGTFGLVVGYYGLSAYNEQRIGLVYARKLADKLRLGLQLYNFNTRIQDYGNKSLISFELGLQMDVSKQVSLAFRAANPVRIAIVDEEYLPTVLSIGFKYQPGELVTFLAEVEKDILFPARVRFGLEYQIIKTLFLRAGVATDPSVLSFGIGYELKDNIQLEFATSYHQYLGFTPGISVLMNK